MQSVGDQNPKTTTKSYGVKLVRGPFVDLPPHPDACAGEADLFRLCRSLSAPLAADLFCGAGGLSLGLQKAGFEVVLGVDNDPASLETHRAYFRGLAMMADLYDQDQVESLGELVRDLGIQLVAGGPPCQPFSRAGRNAVRDLVRRGKREERDLRRDLWQAFLRVIAIARPAAVLMENVPDMALDREMAILRTMSEALEEIGYRVDYRLIDTFRYGVPQMRQRLILVATRGRVFDWPEPGGELVTVDNAIADLPPVEGGWRPEGGAEGWTPYTGPVTSFQRRAREGVIPDQNDRIYDHITRPVRADDAEAFASMDSTTKYSELADEHKRYREDIFNDKYKRLDGADLSRTITAHIAKDGYWYIHPYQDRTLTVREAARLQTFPDWFRFAGAPSQAFRQIGNAVPPALAESLGVQLLAALKSGEPAEVADPPSTLSKWFENQESLSLPWLRAENRWVVIQAEMLWDRISSDLVQIAWSAVCNLLTPADTLRAADALMYLAQLWDRTSRATRLLETAAWFEAHPEKLRPDAPSEELLRAPHVAQAVVDLAVRVHPAPNEDIVTAQKGVLRVAARYQGLNVDRVNRMSEGRLAIARMVGGGDDSGAAHLGLFEVANSVCTPESPACGRCPLQIWCVEASRRPVQQPLQLKAPGRQRSQGVVPSAGAGSG